jgi:predicted DNA-binding transcriptional regulator AlpA
MARPRLHDENLTPRELATREKVPTKTVYQWNTRGTGPPYFKIGRHVRYRLRDVVAWENSRYIDAREPA